VNLYDRYLMPVLIDACCGMKAVQRERAKLLPLAKGRILEIGIGTGRNLPFYAREQVEQLIGLDPAEQMNAKAQRRADAAGLKVELMGLSAETIPVEDASFDTVVCTFTLCTIPDPDAALQEMKRVLKPDGRLLFCEHGLAPEEDLGVRNWQQRLTPYWKPIAGGCHLNRAVRPMLERAGFVIDEFTASYLTGPRPLTYVSRGVARPGT
jgi:ubiquinone/menaquinone biosynthesis C-methylase UbiE